jgi:hypothetical protein
VTNPLRLRDRRFATLGHGAVWVTARGGYDQRVNRDVTLLARGDQKQAQRIFDAFAERTALEAEPVTGGMRFALEGTPRQIKVIETLHDIDTRWELYIALG